MMHGDRASGKQGPEEREAIKSIVYRTNKWKAGCEKWLRNWGASVKLSRKDGCHLIRELSHSFAAAASEGKRARVNWGKHATNGGAAVLTGEETNTQKECR